MRRYISKRATTIGLITAGSLLVLGFTFTPWRVPEIQTVDIKDITSGIKVTGSVSNESPSLTRLQAPPGNELVASSSVIDFANTRANAAAIRWRQYGNEGTSLLVRTHNGEEWSPWTEALQNEDRKDDTSEADASTLILANNIDRMEYRFILKGSSDKPSGTIDLSAATMNAIDTSKGPDGKVSIISHAKRLLGLTKNVSAASDKPRIISRSEWGSPEANGSPDWIPEYAPLARAVVHHTATTETPNSYAAVRAIWQHHRHGNGWGDIGYNYIVDSVGNVFQGRYYDQAYAETNTVDVTGGHAYGNNIGTTGIASIGNFQSTSPPGAMVHAISRIIGYKLAPYGDADPLANGPAGTVVSGHRDVTSTSCPGNNLHIKLPEIRWIAHQYYERDSSMNKFDYSYDSQQLFKDGQSIPLISHLKFGEDIRLDVRLKNTGTDTWNNSGQFATRLATSYPNDRQSRFYDQSWISQNRITTFDKKVSDDGIGTEDTNEILPGEVAIFSFKVSIPELPATTDNATLFKEYFGLVQDGRSWFRRDIGLHQPFIVKNNIYSWEWRGQSIFTNESKAQEIPWGQPLQRDTRYYLRVFAKNTGTATWQKEQTRLGTSNQLDRTTQITDSSWISSNRAATTVDQTVAPGETTSYEFWIKTPPTPGYSSNEFFRPVRDGVIWMNDNWLHFPIKTN